MPIAPRLGRQKQVDLWSTLAIQHCLTSYFQTPAREPQKTSWMAPQKQELGLHTGSCTYMYAHTHACTHAHTHECTREHTCAQTDAKKSIISLLKQKIIIRLLTQTLGSKHGKWDLLSQLPSVNNSSVPSTCSVALLTRSHVIAS